MRLTSCIPALDMLTFQLVSLSKPVGPFNGLEKRVFRKRIESRQGREILPFFFSKNDYSSIRHGGFLRGQQRYPKKYSKKNIGQLVRPLPST